MPTHAIVSGSVVRLGVVMTLGHSISALLSLLLTAGGTLTTVVDAPYARVGTTTQAGTERGGERAKAPKQGAGFRDGQRSKSQRGVEVESWTGASHSVMSADGKTRVKVYSRPTFQRNSEGQWTKLHARVRKIPAARGNRKGLKESDVAKVFSDGFTIVSSAGVVPVAFGTGGDAGLMQQALPGGVVTWRLAGMRPTTPVIISEAMDETIIEYHNVFDGVDLRYRIRPAEVKEEFVLATPRSVREFTFTVDDSRHLLGEVKVDNRTDATSFTGVVGEGITMSLAPPVAWSESVTHGYRKSPGSDLSATVLDAAKRVARAGDGSATQSVKRISRGYKVTVALSKKFAATTRFPVVLDPTQTYSVASNTLDMAWAPRLDPICGDSCPLAAAMGGTAPVDVYLAANIGNLPPWIRVTSAEISFDLGGEWGLPYCWHPTIGRLESALSPGDSWMDAVIRESITVPYDDPHFAADPGMFTIDGDRLGVNVLDLVVQAVDESDSVAAFSVSDTAMSCEGSRSDTPVRWIEDPVFEFTYEGGILPPPLPVEQTWGCDCRWAHGSNRVALQADPVNTAAGALMERSVDASSGLVGVPLQIGRTYNGQDVDSGLLGVGWSSDFESSLTSNPVTGEVVFRDPTGGRSKFSALPGGGYLASVGVTSVLSEMAGGGWTVRSATTGEVLTFDSSGRIVSDVDVNGRGLHFSYTLGRLSSVTDATGGVAELTYGTSGVAAGKLVQIVLSSGQEVSYAYSVVAGHPRLSKVVGVDGETTTMTYTAEGLLDGIFDPANNATADSTYDTAGRVMTQVDPAGGHWEFDWVDYIAPSMPLGTGVQTTTGPDGTITRSVYYGNTLVKQSVRPYEGGPAAETSYTYDSAQNLAGVRDPNGRVTTMTYDGAGRILTRTAPNPLATVESWTYDSQGRLLTATNGAGETTTHHYDSAGNRDWDENAEGERTLFEYNTLGLITKKTSPMGRASTHTYDVRGNRLSFTQPGGAKTTWTYDARGRVMTEVSPRGNVSGATAADFTTSYTYDAGDRVKTATAPNGNVTTHGYDLAGRQTSLVVKDSAAVVLANLSWSYDSAGNELTATTNGRTITKTYNDGGLLATATDSAGLKVKYWWESDRLTGVERSNADETEWYLSEYFEYDRAGQNIRRSSNSTDEWDWSETLLSYDAEGRVTKSSLRTGYDTNYDPEWAETTFVYDGAGRVTESVDPAGGETSTAYDDAGRVVSTQMPGRPASLSVYDDDGFLVSSVAPGGGVTTYTYTPAGLVAAVTDPKGNAPGATPADHRVTSTYDVEGNLLTTTDQLGNTTSNTYDNLSRLVAKTNALNKTTGYAYDAVGNLVKVTAAPMSGVGGGAETVYAYNVHGELTKRTDELGRETTYTRDPDSGRTTAITDPLNRTKSFTYDVAGRLTEWTNADGSSVEQVFTPGGLLLEQVPSTGVGSRREYNQVGLLQRITDLNDAQETTFSYDARGLLTQVDGPQGVFEYAYKADGSIASRTYPDGTQTEYDYDDDGLTVAQDVIRGTSTKSTTYDYDLNGLLTQTTYPSSTGGAGPAMTENRSYDRAGRISEVASVGSGVGALGALTTNYVRDAAGQPVLVTETRGSGVSASVNHTGYAYSGQGWVTRECDFGATAPTSTCDATTQPRVTHSYDAVGNATGHTQVGAGGVTVKSDVSTFDAADQLTSTVTTVGTQAPTTTSFSYNANGELTSGGRTYDALGRLTGKANPGGSGQVAYTYNPSGQRTMMSRTGTNAGTQELTWDTNNTLPLIAQTENTGDTLGAGIGEQTHLWTPTGLPLATYQTSGSPLWYTHDALGSVTDITTDTGTAVTSMRYTLFGEQTLTDNQATPGAVPVSPGFGYTAGFNQLGDTELHLRARDYDPTLGSFTAPDPLAPDNSAPAITTYHYANNSPLVYIDPSGEWPEWFEDAADWGAEKINGFVRNPLQARTDIGAGVVRSTTDLADMALNCATRMPMVCDDYLAGGGFTLGKNVSDWVDKTVGADPDSLTYLCASIIGVPGIGAAGAVGKLPKFARLGRLRSAAANAGDDVVRALSATERRTLDDALRPDKLDHIFDPKHNFQPLVQQFGSREAAMEQIVRSIGGPLPQAGRFEIAQSIGGQNVIIRGAVVDGIPRIGTAFTP